MRPDGADRVRREQPLADNAQTKKSLVVLQPSCVLVKSQPSLYADTCAWTMRKLSFLSASLPRLPVAATRAWGKTCAPRTCPMGLGSAVDDSTASAVSAFLVLLLACCACNQIVW